MDSHTARLAWGRDREGSPSWQPQPAHHGGTSQPGTNTQKDKWTGRMSAGRQRSPGRSLRPIHTHVQMHAHTHTHGDSTLMAPRDEGMTALPPPSRSQGQCLCEHSLHVHHGRRHTVLPARHMTGTAAPQLHTGTATLHATFALQPASCFILMVHTHLTRGYGPLTSLMHVAPHVYVTFTYALTHAHRQLLCPHLEAPSFFHPLSQMHITHVPPPHGTLSPRWGNQECP